MPCPAHMLGDAYTFAVILSGAKDPSSICRFAMLSHEEGSFVRTRRSLRMTAQKAARNQDHGEKSAHRMTIQAIAEEEGRPRRQMKIREYNEGDLDALRRMHASQGFDYAFPDLGDPIFVSKLVAEDESGRAVMASLARITCEMYLLADPAAGTPRERYARLLALHAAGQRDLLARGLDDAHAWLPPPIAKRFGRRLTALGWVRDDAWTPYCRRLRER